VVESVRVSYNSVQRPEVGKEIVARVSQDYVF
jgi:hypothetical protein